MNTWTGRRNLQLSILDRSVIVLTALFLVVLALWTLISGLGWTGHGSAASVFQQLRIGPLESSVIALVLLLAALHLLFLGLHHEREEVIRQETELGHVRITLRAVETLVKRAAQEIRGIKDVDVSVIPSPEGVAIDLAITVLPEISVPEISSDVSWRVQNRVRETIGIDVGSVSVEVRNIASGEARARVE